MPAAGKRPEYTDTAVLDVTFDGVVTRLSTFVVYPSCEELDGTTAEPKYMPPDPMVNVPLTFAVVAFKHVALAVVATSVAAVKQHVTFAQSAYSVVMFEQLATSFEILAVFDTTKSVTVSDVTVDETAENVPLLTSAPVTVRFPIERTLAIVPMFPGGPCIPGRPSVPFGRSKSNVQLRQLPVIVTLALELAATDRTFPMLNEIPSRDEHLDPPPSLRYKGNVTCPEYPPQFIVQPLERSDIDLQLFIV